VPKLLIMFSQAHRILAALAVVCSSAFAQTTTLTGTSGGNDTWNQVANWTSGIPEGETDAVIGSGILATVDSDDTPEYDGDLTLLQNATLRIGWGSTFLAGNPNVLGAGTVTFHTGARIVSRRMGSYIFTQHFAMAGDGTLRTGDSTSDHHTTKTLAGGISGAGKLTYEGVNNTTLVLNTANPSWSGGLVTADPQNQRHQLRASANGSFGTGNVTINKSCSLEITANLGNAIDDGATLSLNGVRSSTWSAKLMLHSDELVYAFFVDGVQQPAGIYSSASGLTDSSGNPLIGGSGKLYVVAGPGDESQMVLNLRFPADGATDFMAATPLEAYFSKPVVFGNGSITLRNLSTQTDLVFLPSDPAVSVSGVKLTLAPTGGLQWNTDYAVLISPDAIQSDTGIPFAGITDETVWNFRTRPGDPLLLALGALKNHITGSITQSAAQIEQHKFTIDAHKSRFAESAAHIAAVIDLVQTYDTVKGPLWIARGEFSNRNTQPNDLDWTIYHVMQYTMDVIYRPGTIAAHEAQLAGFKFGSSAHFPGPCAPPADPAATHTVPVQGSFPITFGRSTQQWTLPARKPTGTYLAPGTFATVTVPPEIVNKGYQVRVGAHSWDLSTRRNQVRRLDRATIAYDINAEAIRVGSPYGGGIYIEVPMGADAGEIEVSVTGAVRAPYFSAKSFHQTTLEEWLATERHHPAPWADFQTDKFMMQVPRNWIYNLPDPVTLMADWDLAVDAQNDLMGFPHLRGKETMYLQVDLIMRSTVHAPGYPAINNTDTPTNDSHGGYRNNYLVRGPGANATAAHIEFHEQGHAYFFPKFGGETESNVNLPHVAVLHRMFGYDINDAFRGSLGIGNTFHTLDTTAIEWMTSFNFSPREVPMHTSEKSYQLKGHAKFADIARMFGWDGLGAYWRSFMQDDANGVSYTTNTDALLLRLCRHVGRDLRPLFHFWGVFPQNNTTLAAALAAENIPPSPEIFLLLHHYKSLVPANNAAFRTYGQAWWNKFEPSITGAWTETEHARQWDERIRRDGDGNIRTDITVGEMYIEACAEQVRTRVQGIINLYYPTGSPDPEFVPVPYPNPMGFFKAPAPTVPGAITMTALSATAIHQPVTYLFENTTTGATRDWSTQSTWTQSGLVPGQTYGYRVKARDALGNETAWSAVAEGTTLNQYPAPLVVGLHPAKGATVLNLATPLTATFDLPVVAGSGFVTLKNLTDGTQAQIDVTDTARVSFSGNVMTVQPPSNLALGKIYCVQIAPGAVKSSNEVVFAGFTSNDDWNFTTLNLVCPLGILNLAANSGINPATNQPWQPGDAYRLVFITSQRINPKVASPFGSWNDIATWNAVAQDFANNAVGHDLSGVTWKVLGSTAGMSARDNTATNPAVHGSGHPILLIDGSTIVANDFNGLWGGTGSSIRNIIDLTENKGQTIAEAPAIPWPYTGTSASGTSLGASSALRDISGGGTIRQGEASTTQGWIDRANRTTAATDGNPMAIYVMSAPLHVAELVAPSAPVLLSITDNLSGGPVLFPTSIIYTVTFDRAMNPATLDSGDFENALATEVSIDSVMPTGDPAVFTVTVTPANPGSLQLQIKQGALLADPDGIPLDTASPLPDDTIITLEAPELTPYAAWISSFPDLTHTDPTLDFDGGGLATVLEWVLGGDPSDPSDDAAIMPTIDATSDPDGKLLFSFRRSAEAATDENTTIIVEYGSDLTGWTAAVHQGPGPDQISITESPAAPGFDAVTVALPPSLAPAGKLFVRLNVAK
jgi:hypothetical protein